MVTAITNGVKITVKATFQPYYSNAKASEYVFFYHIEIENNSNYTIQLLRRHWHIVDSVGKKQEVEGEGVIGQQPVLEPNARHSYVSGCNLNTPLGKMHGTYQMQRIMDGKLFDVEIPAFLLMMPHLLN